METTAEKEREVVIARLDATSPKILFFSGGDTETGIDKNQMIQHIKNGDSIGLEFVNIEFEFMRAFKDGSLMKALIPT